MSQIYPRHRGIRRFSAVNRTGSVNFRKGWQKHHLLPRQLMSRRCLASMITSIGSAGLSLDDFDSNGVLLPGSVATSFALILHELGTNALKYGAWSGPEGIVAVKWDIHGSELHFRWQEFQRAGFQKPVKQGYGSILIKNSLSEAKVSHEILQNGVDCQIWLPLTKDHGPARSLGRKP